MTHISDVVRSRTSIGCACYHLINTTPLDFYHQFWEGAEPQNGPTTQLLCWLGREHRIHVGASILEARGEHFYNVFVMAGPNGEVLGEVFKQAPCALECLYFNGLPTMRGIECPALGIKVGVAICYDNQVHILLMLALARDLSLTNSRSLPACVHPGSNRLGRVRSAAHATLRDVPRRRAKVCAQGVDRKVPDDAQEGSSHAWHPCYSCQPRWSVGLSSTGLAIYQVRVTLHGHVSDRITYWGTGV